jgi:hypothetical protein
MKIALCLSGQPRGLPLSLELLRKGLDVDNMDVFLHAWYDPSMIGQQYDSAQVHQQGRVGLVHPLTKELLLELNPKDYLFEPQKEFAFAREFRQLPEANQEKMASIFYSIYTANMLKKKYELLNGFKYDLVVRARYDLFYEERIDVTKYAQLAKTMIITSEKFQGMRNKPDFTHGGYTLTDIFAFSSSENMDVFCDTYPHMSFINTQINPPYGENYLGFRVRIMNGIQAYCASEFNYEIMHRVVDINTQNVKLTK